MLLTRLLGIRGESLAARHLRKAGLRIVARNFRCPAGEIDLIAADRETIIFVEVKTRRSDRAAAPEESIGPMKRRRMERAAHWWLARRGYPAAAYRFDAISIVEPPGEAPRIRHIVEAFRPRRG